MDCASGAIAGPLRLDASGSFSASGTFMQHQPGPQRADETVPDKARYIGEVQGAVMTLTIQPVGSGAPQVFRLQRGTTVKLVRCL